MGCKRSCCHCCPQTGREETFLSMSYPAWGRTLTIGQANQYTCVRISNRTCQGHSKAEPITLFVLVVLRRLGGWSVARHLDDNKCPSFMATAYELRHSAKRNTQLKNKLHVIHNNFAADSKKLEGPKSFGAVVSQTWAVWGAGNRQIRSFIGCKIYFYPRSYDFNDTLIPSSPSDSVKNGLSRT